MKKLIAFILALIMCLSLFPVTTLADDGVISDDSIIAETTAETEEPAAEEIHSEEETPAAEEAAAAESVPGADESDAEELTEEEPPETSEEDIMLEADPLEDEPIITESNFPDPFLRSALRKSINDSSWMFDPEDGFTDADHLTEAQALKVKRLDLSGSVDVSGRITGVSEITGLARFFPNLISLTMKCSMLKTFDPKSFTKLESLDLTDNMLKSLDVSGMSGLKSLTADREACPPGTSTLVELNASGTGLTSFAMRSSPTLRSLSLSGCTDLVTFEGTGNSALESLNLSGCPKLDSLYVSGDVNLKEVRLSGSATGESYTTFNFEDCLSLSSLDLTDCTALSSLDCDDCTALTELKLGGLENLVQVSFDRTRVKAVNLSSAGKLTTLNCNSTKLGELNLSGCGSLTYLSCQTGEIETLDLSGCTMLQTVYATSNRISTIRLTGCSSLEILSISDNALTADGINLSGCPNLKQLYIGGNRLPYLNAGACQYLSNFNAGTQYPDGKIKAYKLDYVSPTTGDEYYVADIAQYIPSSYLDNLSCTDILYRDGGRIFVVINGSEYIRNLMQDGYYNSERRLEYTYRVKSGYLMTVRIDVEFTDEPFVTGIRYNYGRISDYLLLQKENTSRQVQLMTAFGPVPSASEQQWSSSNETVAALEDGYLTAVNPGTAYITGKLIYEDNVIASSTVRIDVSSNRTQSSGENPAGILRASLPEDKVTVDLFKTDYTSFDLMLELQQNLDYAVAASVIDTSGLKPEYGADAIQIDSLKFTDETVRSYFELIPVSDRTVKIVPNHDKLVNVAAGTERVPSVMKSKISFEVSGVPYTTEQELTVNLKQSRPSVKSKGLTLSSNPSLAGKPFTLSFTGGSVMSFRLDGAKPSWLEYNGTDCTVAYVGEGSERLSTTLKLLCTVQGWAVEVPVSVRLTVKPSYPTIKFSQKSVTLMGNTDDKVWVYYRVSDEFKEIHPKFLGFTEGRGKDLCFLDPSSVCVSLASNAYSERQREGSDWDGNFFLYINSDSSGTHKYNALFECAGKQFSIPVTYTDPSKIPSSVTLKAKGSLDLGVEGSAVTVTASVKGYANYTGSIYEVTKIYRADDPEKTDILNKFNYSSASGEGNVLSLKVPSGHAGVSAGKHVVEITASLGRGTEVSGSVTVNLTETSKSRLDPRAKLRVTGWIDPLREEQEATIEITGFNYPGLDSRRALLSSSCLKLYDETKQNELYGITPQYNWNRGVFTLRSNFYNNTAVLGHKLFVRLEWELENNGETMTVYSGFVPVKVKQSAVKYNLDASGLALSTKDCRDSAQFSMLAIGGESDRLLNVTAHAENWTGVAFADPKFAEIFEIVNVPDMPNGTFCIKWKNNKLPPAGTLTPGRTVSVKLNLFVDGNWTNLAGYTDRPVSNGSVTLKVKIL